MDSVLDQQCTACGMDIHPREARWYYGSTTAEKVEVYCLRCVKFVPWFVEENSPLLVDDPPPPWPGPEAWPPKPGPSQGR